MNFKYILALLVFCGLFVAGVYFTKYIRNMKFFNFLFPLLVFIPYVCLCVVVYKNDTDPNRWNFLNTLPVANVSPFMFSMMPILLILPRKLKEYAYLLISLLSLGMFLSIGFGCIGNALRNYTFHFHFMLDYFSHFALSLFGVFLVKTKQVRPDTKKCLISSSVIFGVATVMLVLNVIFDKAFFGLSLNGKHSIYNIVLVQNSYVSALIYYFGLAVILFFGFALCKLLSKKQLTKQMSYSIM